METPDTPSLAQILCGWEGYSQSIVAALAPLSTEQLAFRPAPQLRSAGEIARYIAFGRATWWSRMSAPDGHSVLLSLATSKKSTAP